MKKLLNIAVLALIATVSVAHADEQKPGEKRVQSSQINSEEKNGTTLMMQVPTDEKNDEMRRKAFLEELRKLYKANFL